MCNQIRLLRAHHSIVRQIQKVIDRSRVHHRPIPGVPLVRNEAQLLGRLPQGCRNISSKDVICKGLEPFLSGVRHHMNFITGGNANSRCHMLIAKQKDYNNIKLLNNGTSAWSHSPPSLSGHVLLATSSALAFRRTECTARLFRRNPRLFSGKSSKWFVLLTQ